MTTRISTPNGHSVVSARAASPRQAMLWKAALCVSPRGLCIQAEVTCAVCNCLSVLPVSQLHDCLYGLNSFKVHNSRAGGGSNEASSVQNSLRHPWRTDST